MTVVDASVLVKWLVREPGTDRACDLIASSEALSIPDLALLEVPAALAKKVHLSLLSTEECMGLHSLFRAAVEVRPIRVHPSDHLLSAALALSAALRHPLYDCLYVALAQALGERVVTADEKFLRALQRAGFGDVAGPLVPVQNP